MTRAFLFPGQGTDLSMVAAEWHAASPGVEHLVSVAAGLAGIPIAHALHGSGLALRDTRVYQPMLTAVCIGILRELESRTGIPAYVAGHSLGEIPASVAAGAMADEAAIAIAAIRGRLMWREAARCPGGMIALRVTASEAEDALVLARAAGPAAIAAYNAPDEQVLSGSHGALGAVPPRFGATPLATGGAWHSPAMLGAVAEYRAALGAVCSAPSRACWVSNRTGNVAPPMADTVAQLAEQLVRPVLWLRTLQELRARGVRTLVTLGPSKALRALARRALGDEVAVVAVEHPGDLDRAEEALAA